MNMQKMNTLTARQGRGIRQAGITLIEALLVLAVAAALAVAGYQVYKSSTDDVKAQANAAAAVELVVAVQRLFSQSPDYTGLLTSDIANSGQVPKAFRVVGTGTTATILNQYGGGVTFKVGTPLALTPATNFTTIIAGVPKVSCPNLVTTLANAASSISVVATGGTVAAANEVLAVGGRLDGVKTANLCGSAATVVVHAML